MIKKGSLGREKVERKGGKIRERNIAKEMKIKNYEKKKMIKEEGWGKQMRRKKKRKERYKYKGSGK